MKADTENNVVRSELWNELYETLARLPLEKMESDCLDRPSACTELEIKAKVYAKEVEEKILIDLICSWESITEKEDINYVKQFVIDYKLTTRFSELLKQIEDE